MELLVGALAIIALIAIVIRFAPHTTSGGIALPRIVDDSIGMWALRRLTRRPDRDHDDRVEGMQIESLQARLASVRRTHDAEPLTAPAALVPATIPASVSRPPTLVLPTAFALDPDLEPDPTGADPVDDAASEPPPSTAAGSTGAGSRGRRSRRTRGAAAAASATGSTPSVESTSTDDLTPETPLWPAMSANGSGHGPSETVAPISANGVDHEALGIVVVTSSNGSGKDHDPSPPANSDLAPAAGAARTRRTRRRKSGASEVVATPATNAIVGATPAAANGPPPPDVIPERSWSELAPAVITAASIADATGAAPAQLDPIPLPAAEAPAPSTTTANLTPVTPTMREAAEALGVSVRSVSLAGGFVLLVVALVLGAQGVWDQSQSGVLSATGRPDDGAVGGVGPPLASPGGSVGPEGSGGATAPSALPSGGAAAPSGKPQPKGMPAFNRSALTQAILVNQRLAAARATLRTNLAASPFDAVGVAQTLRDVSANTVYGTQMASIVGDWSPAAALGTDLAKQYDAIHEAAAQALVDSVRVEAAYRQSAKTMVALLAKLAPVDAGARALATANAVVLPAGSAAP